MRGPPGEGSPRRPQREAGDAAEPSPRSVHLPALAAARGSSAGQAAAACEGVCLSLQGGMRDAGAITTS